MSEIPQAPQAPQPLTLDERRAILDKEIRKYVKRGYKVASRTDTSVQLVKPKKFSFLWALLWFLVFGIGLVVYLIYYWAKKDDQLYLEVDDKGKIKRTKSRK